MGYCGGTTAKPTYDDIGDHTEALRVTFDPSVVDEQTLLRVFWQEHSPMPTTFTGTQYRSALFFHTPAQREVAEYVRATLVGDSPFAHPASLTAFEDAGPFYRAEEVRRRQPYRQG